jgi:glycerol-3-phosphate acyltransferase PlsY
VADQLVISLVAVAAYVVGGIPFAFLVGRVFFRTDIRKHGSGNVGATNVYRTFGPVPAIAVLLLDMAKGYVPVTVAAAVAPAGWEDWTMIAASMAAVLGHSFTPFLGLSGGKGVATAAGTLLRLTPLSVAVLLPVFVLIAAPTGIISAGSIAIAVLYPVSVLVFYSGRTPLILFAFAAAALVLWRHRANMVRIARGEEKRLRPGRWRRGKDHGGRAADSGSDEPRRGE